MTARAVVVGVPRTEVGHLPPLDAVTTDAQTIAALLEDRGFDHVDLRASGVTVDEMTALLIDLRAATGIGDLGLIYVSGHGYRMRDEGDDEQDGYDEFLVMSDGILGDDWFRDSFWPAVASGSQWITCADTCFGATALLSYFRPDECSFPDVALRPTLTRPSLPRISLARRGGVGVRPGNRPRRTRLQLVHEPGPGAHHRGARDHIPRVVEPGDQTLGHRKVGRVQDAGQPVDGHDR